MPHPRPLDLNLLLAFDAVMSERHVSRAAAKIGVTQPALSYALKQLRAIFNDELLVRTPEGMQPTTRALALHQPVRTVLEQIQSMVASCRTFDPATAERSFSMAMSDAITFEVAPMLVRHIRNEAPGLRLRINNAGPDDSCAMIAAGKADLAIILGTELPPGIHGKELYRDSVLCVADRDNARLRYGRLTLDDFLASSHVMVGPDRGMGEYADHMLSEHGIKLDMVVVLPHYLSVPLVVRGTDLVGITRRRLISALGPQPDLAFFAPPFQAPDLVFQLIWPERSEGDPAHRWLREKVGDALREAPHRRRAAVS